MSVVSSSIWRCAGSVVLFIISLAWVTKESCILNKTRELNSCASSWAPSINWSPISKQRIRCFVVSGRAAFLVLVKLRRICFGMTATCSVSNIKLCRPFISQTIQNFLFWAKAPIKSNFSKYYVTSKQFGT